MYIYFIQTSLMLGLLGRRPINGDVIQDMKRGRFHVFEFLVH